MNWIIIGWIGAAIALVVMPVVFRDHDRKVWLERLRQGRWHVNLVDDNQSNSNESNNISPLSTLSQEERTAIRDAHVRETLLPFTQRVTAHDIRNHQNVSTSQPAFNVQEDEENSNDTTIEILQSDVEQPTNRETRVDDKNFVTRTAESKLTSFSLKTLIESSMDSEGSTTLSSQADNDDDDDEEVAMGCWQSTTTDDAKEDQGLICVPVGPATNDEECATRRWLSNQCTICLSPFELNDQITRAGNPDCCHVFHYSCMTHWLSAAGRKHVARQERLADPTLMSISDPKKAVKKFPMLCPCCRQDFVWNESKQEHQDDENDESRRVRLLFGLDDQSMYTAIPNTL